MKFVKLILVHSGVEFRVNIEQITFYAPSTESADQTRILVKDGDTSIEFIVKGSAEQLDQKIIFAGGEVIQ
ncbi:hypothetical protein D3C71_448810 [compost metagenome]